MSGARLSALAHACSGASPPAEGDSRRHRVRTGSRGPPGLRRLLRPVGSEPAHATLGSEPAHAPPGSEPAHATVSSERLTRGGPAPVASGADPPNVAFGCQWVPHPDACNVASSVLERGRH